MIFSDVAARVVVEQAQQQAEEAQREETGTGPKTATDPGGGTLALLKSPTNKLPSHPLHIIPSIPLSPPVPPPRPQTGWEALAGRASP